MGMKTTFLVQTFVIKRKPWDQGSGSSRRPRAVR
ncbi:hypothetical protein AEGHOMDF_2922 [Methylobacterium soli]|nr:hypothetical protein AEGHOMDF_2922 [Methylobacterium soli]